jgi:uncharacterized LabA/DUF88 family protein
VSTGERRKERVISYIDGFNLYFGLREAGLECYKWLNIKALSRDLLLSHQVLQKTKYFTSRIASPQPKVVRQSTYLDALGSLGDIHIEYGKYARDKELECSVCQEKTSYPQEKMTDVNIAVTLLEDAYCDAFDTALLISGDSDLCPPIKSVRRIFPHKRVIVVFPPRRISSELKRVATAHLNIDPRNVKRCQLPDQIELPSGYTIKRPSDSSYQIPAFAVTRLVPVGQKALPTIIPPEKANPTPQFPPGYKR